MSTHNWKSFSFRLTIVVSIAVALLFFIDASDGFNPGEKISKGVFTIVGIWILYFGIRWSIKGLIKHSTKE